MDSQDEMVERLHAHESELRAAGVRGLSLFGSVARREHTPGSDVDLAVRLDPDAHLGIFRFLALESRLSELLSLPVQLLPEPLDDSRFQANFVRDARRVF